MIPLISQLQYDTLEQYALGTCRVMCSAARGHTQCSTMFPMYGQQGTTCTLLLYVSLSVLIAPVVSDIRIYTVRTFLVTSVVCPLCDAEVSPSSIYYTPTCAYCTAPRQLLSR